MSNQVNFELFDFLKYHLKYCCMNHQSKFSHLLSTGHLIHLGTYLTHGCLLRNKKTSVFHTVKLHCDQSSSVAIVMVLPKDDNIPSHKPQLHDYTNIILGLKTKRCFIQCIIQTNYISVSILEASNTIKLWLRSCLRCVVWCHRLHKHMN